ncbi:nucleoside triphosphate pyrophosphohydrolase ham1 [Hypocenomyce scalaris]|nr:nucleoside triphosphate pyrophosphohydrolase ham1 [Hypocenomyce scalaris]
MSTTELNLITGNKNKLSEVKAILGDTVVLKSQALDLVEIQGTIEDIASDKCRRAAASVKAPVLVEDTCLCFNALGQLPGPYVYYLPLLRHTRKWFLQALGHEGLNNLLLAYDDKSAEAVCTFAYSAGPDHEPIIFQGRTTGKIVPARGQVDFGWDPIFEYEGQTYAEMSKVEKNKISHRYKALQKLKAWLETQP